MKAFSCTLSFFMLWASILFTNSLVTAQESKQPSIIPIPASFSYTAGNFSFGEKTRIQVLSKKGGDYKTAQYLSEQVKLLMGIKLQVIVSTKAQKNTIVLKTGSKGAKESYTLEVTPTLAKVNGTDDAGTFYGVQSLLQLMYASQSTKSIECILIKDKPSFQWRGMHLDVCRHFFPVEFVKKTIDMLAMYKINTFHWHLTDDQGWRIEIKRYPLLTSVGGWRDETLVGHYTDTDQKFDGKRYGGFYTQEQIKEVVQYAASRHITIVPEIEMPGHAVAALSAYPEYSCTGGPFKTYTKWGVSDDVYCAGKDETFTFLQNILDEVIPLFPGKYIHIGGDECPKTRWKACPACQKRMKDNGLKNEMELQSYFVKRMEKYIVSKGKKLMGWDEILEGGLPDEATVMSWRGTEGGIEAAKTGHDVVMTPGSHCYFDHYQGPENKEPLAIGGYLPIDTVYSYNPVPTALSEVEAKHVLGAQANVWTEYIPDEKQAEYMIYPRILAMAEILWSPKDTRNFTQFMGRVRNQTGKFDKLNVKYRHLDK
jgi:hexosaminidase